MAAAHHPPVSLLTGRAGSCLFPHSTAGLNGGTSVICRGRQSVPGVQSTADTELPGCNEESPPTARGAPAPPTPLPAASPKLAAAPLRLPPSRCPSGPARPGPLVPPQRRPSPRRPAGLPASRRRPTVLCVPAALELPDWRGGGGGALPSGVRR